MHTVKGGWVGQTFALAKINESNSGGGKPRIRRSKEERKAMVKSFFKKYQKKNNGNFPSLNLTQKEVGGSFYTVREIVCEIIQENSLLGSAKLTPQEKRWDSQFSEEYPLGSVSAKPQVPLSLPPHENQPHLVSSLDDGVCDERVGLSKEKHNADKELQTIDGSQVDLKNDESVVSAEAGVVIDQPVASTPNAIDLTNVEVESFPLKLVTEVSDFIHKTIGEITVSAETLDEKQKADLNSRLTTDNSQFYGSSSQEMSAPKDDRVDRNHGRSLEAVADSIDIEDSKVARKVSEPVVESSDSLKTREGIIHDTESGTSLTDKESPHDASSVEGPEGFKEDALVQATDLPNGVPAKSLNGDLQQTDAEKSFQETETRSGPDDPSYWSVLKETNPTVDRINLSESWEVLSRSSSRKGTNPLVAIFKAFIVSFLKFWSE